jgi:hypothetical protein
MFSAAQELGLGEKDSSKPVSNGQAKTCRDPVDSCTWVVVDVDHAEVNLPSLRQRRARARARHAARQTRVKSLGTLPG